MSNNPLAQYFRSPGMHVTLPSGGAFTPEGELELSINGELAVLPMGASDEILAKNPDGLLNGHSVERIIASCVPGVKNPRSLPAQDIDMLLLAIKACSFGDAMTLTATCPKCGKDTEFTTSIRGIMGTCTPLESEYSVRVDDHMIIYLRPYDFEATTKIALAAFEETKLFQSLLNVDLEPEARTRIFSTSFEKISRLNLELLARCVQRVVIPTGTVDQEEHIKEFILNSDKQLVARIQARMQEIKRCGIDKRLNLTCANEECKHEWTTDLMFDPSHFFG